MKYKISSCESDHHIFHSLIGEGWAAFISEYEDEAIGTLFIGNKMVNPSIEENCFDDVLKEIENRLCVNNDKKLLEFAHELSINTVAQLMNKDQNPDECDARESDSSKTADNQINHQQ